MENDSDSDFDFEETVGLLQEKIEAKKAILKEVLRTVEDEDDKSDSVKNRKYIRNMLNCEVTYPSKENHCASIDILDSLRFDQYLIVRIRVKNILSSGALTIRVSTSPIGSTRWNLFSQEDSLKVVDTIRPDSSVILCVSIPLLAFFETDKITLIVCCKLVPTRARLFTPAFYSFLGSNQTANALPEDITALLIDINDTREESDLKSIEFVDVQRAVKVVQSMLTAYSRLPMESDLSNFRREFPRFAVADFDTWRLLIGSDRFEGLFVFNSVEGEGKKGQNEVFSKDPVICKKFVDLVKMKL